MTGEKHRDEARSMLI